MDLANPAATRGLAAQRQMRRPVAIDQPIDSAHGPLAIRHDSEQQEILLAHHDGTELHEAPLDAETKKVASRSREHLAIALEKSGALRHVRDVSHRQGRTEKTTQTQLIYRIKPHARTRRTNRAAPSHAHEPQSADPESDKHIGTRITLSTRSALPKGDPQSQGVQRSNQEFLNRPLDTSKLKF
jgi:hypothetical protein